jgi:MBG domain (YGX type)
LPPSVADTQKPTVPLNVSATAADSGQINLSWTAATDNVGVDHYNVYRDGSTTELVILSGNATSYSDTTVAAGSTHSYTVMACDAQANCSALSAAASITAAKATQTLSFTAPASATYGDAPISLSASAGPALSVSFSLVSGPGTLSGNSLTITGKGSIVVKASQGGNSSYSAATEVQQTITVLPKALTITASDVSRAYGAANPATPGFTAPALVSGDVISGVVYTFASGASSTAGIGTTYAITPSTAVFSSGNAANYAITYFAGTLSIAGAASAANISLVAGWNLLGNSVEASLDVTTVFSDSTQVATVWKWAPATSKWAFYAPSMNATDLASYAAGKGYIVLGAVSAGEGFWVNAKTAITAPMPSGAAVHSTSFATGGVRALPQSWSLIATGDGLTPAVFNQTIGSLPINLSTLWAWDATNKNWYFFAPSLDNNGGLAAYIANKSYLDFAKMPSGALSPSTGFWVNMQP